MTDEKSNQPLRTATAGKAVRSSWHLGLLIGVAMVVMYPWILWGMVSAHDRPTHLYYFHGFYEQLRAGDWYPRWLENANFGAGSPIFFIQYPLPFYAAAAIHFLFRLPATPEGESHALALVFVFAEIALAVALYLWCSRLSSRRVAAVAALVGLTCPYILSTDFYTRAAIGECLAFACIAFSLYFCHDLETRPVRAVCGLALSLSALFLSHLFSVIIFVPFLIGYAFVFTTAHRIRAVALAGLGLGLGAGCAAIYLFPILTYNRFFNLSGLMLQPNGVFFYDNQLIPITEQIRDAFPSGWWFLKWLILAASTFTLAFSLLRLPMLRTSRWSVRILAGFVLVVVLISALSSVLPPIQFLSHRDPAEEWIHVTRSHFFALSFLTVEVLLIAFLSAERRAPSDPRVLFLFAACVISFLMMTRWTAVVWHHAHFLWSLQFPWRFFGLLSVFAVGVVAMWLERESEAGRFTRSAALSGVVFLGLSVMGLVGSQVVPKLRHRVREERSAKFDMALPTYLHSPQLYGDLNPWPGDLPEFATRVLTGAGSATLRHTGPRSGTLAVNCATPCRVQLHLVYFPAWRARASEAELPLSASPETGLTVVDLPAGVHNLSLELPRSATERIGAGLTLLSVLLVCFGYLGFRRFDAPLA